MSNETERYGLHVWRYNALYAGDSLGEQFVVAEDEFEKAADEIERLRRENAELRDLRDRLQLEAQIHSGEARGQRTTVNEIYQLITGAKGEPGDWNGAEPVRKALANIRAEAVEEAAMSICTSNEYEFGNNYATQYEIESYAQSLRAREGENV